jgi:hypothetical protein
VTKCFGLESESLLQERSPHRFKGKSLFKS